MTFRRSQFVDIAEREGFVVREVRAMSKHDLLVAAAPDGRVLKHIISKGKTSECSRTVNNFKSNLRRFKRCADRGFAGPYREALS